jgi:toxin ParE1/3/4
VKIRWTRLARADIRAAYDYVAEANPGAAQSLLDKIQEAASVLAKHPMAGRAGRVTGTRELVISGTPFVLPYRVRRGSVEILAVIHGARKWADRL